jgi:hypothetical protein
VVDRGGQNAATTQSTAVLIAVNTPDCSADVCPLAGSILQSGGSFGAIRITAKLFQCA